MGAYVDKPQGPESPPETWHPIHPYWIPIVMVDHDPVPEGTVQNASRAYKVVTPTKWGKKQLENQGVKTEYIPFGIDTKVWRPTKGEDEQRKLKTQLNTRSIPINLERRSEITEDTFLIHINGANKDPYRKAFMRSFIALQLFFANNPDAEKDVRVYIHSWMKFARDIPHGAKALQVEWAIKGTSDYHMLCGVPDPEMAKIARAADLFLHPVQGGGFEIPVLEAMSSGVPSIVSDFVALPELIGDSGWVAPLATKYFSPLDATQAIVDEFKLADIIEKAYNSSYKARRKRGMKGRKKAVKEYDWDIVNPLYRQLNDEAIDEMTYRPRGERLI